MPNYKDICERYDATAIQQLYKIVTDDENGGFKNKDVFPVSVIQSIFDGITGTRLDQILALGNCIYVPFQGTREATRLKIGADMRRKGLIIVFRDLDNMTYTQRYIYTDSVADEYWSHDDNWEDCFVGFSDFENVLQRYQEKLVSGTNIKTINNQSLLGAGNIDINTDNVYIVDYINFRKGSGTVTEEQYNALKNAIEGNKIIIVKSPSSDINEVYNMFASFSAIFYSTNNQLSILLYVDSAIATININSDYSYDIRLFPLIIDKEGTVGQVLTKTNTQYEWQDPQIGDTFPEGGTMGQVLKKTSSGVEWANDKDTTYNKATQQANGLMSKEDKTKLDNLTGAYVQILTQTDYEGLEEKDNKTVYFIKG